MTVAEQRADTDLVAGPPVGPGIGLSWMIPQPWLRDAVRLGGLGASLWAGATTLNPGVSAQGIEPLVALVVAGLAWLG